MIKTRLDTFGNDFGQFRNFQSFLNFLNFFEDSTLHGTLGNKLFWKKFPKTHLDIWERFWTILELWIFFWFFSWIFSKSLPQNSSPENWTQFSSVRKTDLIFLGSGIWTHKFKSGKSKMHCMEHSTKKNLKTSPQSLFKPRLDTFGNDSGHFLNFEKFFDFSKIFEDSMEHHPKKLFQENRPKTISKHVWILLQTILGLFGFLNFFEDSTLHGTLGKKFLSKRKPQNTFGHLGTILDNFRTLKFFCFFLEYFLCIYLKF